MLKYFLYTVLFTSFITILYNYNYHYSQYINKYVYPKRTDGKYFLSPEELKLYNGIDKKELYLSLLGNIFDVTKGAQHYGRGQTYNIFIGRDASRNFIDGKFNQEDASDHVINLNDKELLSLRHWLKFYKKEYKKVGILIGRYYNEDGSLTPYGKEVKSLIKAAEKTKDSEMELKKKYPPCNAEFSVAKGSRVWCSKRSGGIERDWVGVPREFYAPGSQSPRCACIKEDNLDLRNINVYKNCEFNSPSCNIESK